tara:strand:- start:108 stop:374 length:267 start_codon:yes stop_codon:yes gene_type:complete
MKSRASAHWFKDNNGDVTHMNPALRNNDDVCSVCSTNLYHDDEVTKRIALIDEWEEIIGWKCPECFSEFDRDDRLRMLLPEEKVRGRA